MSGPSIERLRELLTYEPETGVLTRRVRTSNRIKVGDAAGSPNSRGYLQVRVDGKLFLVHRVVWAMTHGVWPSGEVDHINGVRTDNRLANLRDVSRSVNQQNQRRPRSNNKTGLLGVDPHEGRFRARIWIDGRNKHLGHFDTPDDAHDAYLTAKRQHHAGNTL